MRDERDKRLARLLVNYSIGLKKGESCLINAVDVPVEVVEYLIEAVYEAGGYPQVNYTTARIERELIKGSCAQSRALWADCDAYRMGKMDTFIGIRGPMNTRENSDLPEEQVIAQSREYYQKVHMEIRVPKTRWVVLRYPTVIMGYNAKMSTRQFEDFFYAVTTGVDYHRMSEAFEPARAFLEKADQVHITGPGTDLRFSIKGLGAVPCDGHANIPDGEIYSCPVRESVNGTILYNTPSTVEGFTFTDVCLRFKDGKIIEATSNDTERINAIFDTDEGARYVGEFALGCNPLITSPMDNTLFDEKIAGSFHFTPGNAYEDCDNGNRSAVHWDLVCIQRPEYGGGRITIDGELIREDGIFVHPAFVALNPENLLG